MENNLIILNNNYVKRFFNKYGLSKKNILYFFEILDKGFINDFRKNISSRAFENLFFRQFYFLIEKNKIDLFIQSCNFLLHNKSQIIFLLNNYHYELIFRDFLDGEIIFRKEIYSILEDNIHYISRLNLRYIEGVSTLYDLNLFSINLGKNIEDYFLKIHIFEKNMDISDGINGVTLSIFLGEIEIYGLSFYLGKESLLLSNLQKITYLSYNQIFFIKCYKILLYLFIEIAKQNNIKKLVSFSNENHPCKYHTVNNGFKGNYNNILKNIGMILNNDGYLYGDIDKLEVKGLNLFIKENIDYNIENIFKALKI